MDSTKQIHLNDNILSNSYIEINANFKNKIIKQLIPKNKIIELATITNVSVYMLRSWFNGKRAIKFVPFQKICQLAQISKTELMNNIKFFKTRLNAGKLKLKSTELIIDDDLAELIGFIKGDGCIHKKYVELANNCLKTVFYYTNIMVNKFGLDKNQIEVTILIPLELKTFPNKEVSYSKKQGYNRIIIRSRKLPSRAPTIRCRINSKILALIFQQIKSELYEIFENSPKNIQKKFIEGYAAAEGSVTGKRVALCQHNVNELFFLQRLFFNLDYKSVKSFSHNIDKERICIYGYCELNKFAKEIGFGPNIKRNKKLKTLLSSYTQFNHIPKFKNYSRIKIIISKYSQLTANEIATQLNKSYKETSRLLKEMINNKTLQRNSSKKPYIYSLSK